MLSREDNERLTRVGPDTPMGRLLRRYWMPVGAVSEFGAASARAVRLLGEDLVLYRDRSGTFGLVDRRCPHRGADMSCGFVEEHGLRCHYHGWLFDSEGVCREQPYEDIARPGAGSKVRIPSYPIEAKAGLLWAYLGPEPRPLVPDWEPFGWENGFRQIVFADVPCNWFQCQENSIDPVHFEWLHANWSQRLAGGNEEADSPRHIRVAFEEFDYGFVYRRLREGMSEENPLWTTGRVCLWPNALFTGSHFEWRVPADDENTLSVTWSFTRVPKDREPYVQERIPAWRGPVRDAVTGEWITSHVMNQDFVAWVSQGPIADRTRESLAASDAGIIALRKRFLGELDHLDAGRALKGVVCDPALNRGIRLPVADYEALTGGLEREEMRRHPFLGGWLTGAYPFQAGQPDPIRREFEDAMGIGPDRRPPEAARP